MKDTSEKTEAVLLEMMKRKTGEERLLMGCSMYDFSRELVTSSILDKYPEISLVDLKCEVFLRFYGNDFNNDQKEKLIRHIRNLF